MVYVWYEMDLRWIKDNLASLYELILKKCKNECCLLDYLSSIEEAIPKYHILTKIILSLIIWYIHEELDLITAEEKAIEEVLQNLNDKELNLLENRIDIIRRELDIIERVYGITFLSNIIGCRSISFLLF